MEPKAIYEKLRNRFGEAVPEYHAPDTGARQDAGVRDPFVVVTPAALHPVLAALRDDPELAFDFLECLTGIDWPDQQAIQVVYHLFSYSLRHHFVVKVSVPRADPVLPTLSDLWKVAEWQERECFDLLGVRFTGHPDLRRVLLPEDWEGHPLRKDYQEAASYHGIPTTRPNPLELIKLAGARAAADKKGPTP